MRRVNWIRSTENLLDSQNATNDKDCQPGSKNSRSATIKCQVSTQPDNAGCCKEVYRRENRFKGH